MKNIFKFAAAASMLLSMACTTNSLEEGVVANNELARELPNEITVTLDNNTSSSRIQLDSQCRTTWTEDDELSVFYFSDANNRFLFMGDTGDRSGALVVEDNRMGEATAQIDKVVLVYPYSDKHKLNASTKSIGITIPGTQYYLNGSYGVGANIMTSVGTTNDFALKSVCGWIKVQLTGAAAVTEVTLTGNNKEQLAGDVTLYYEENRLAMLGEDGGPDDSSQVGGTLFFGEYVRTITLDCGEGIALDSAAPTEFYFVLAPQTFDEGITIKAVLSDGTTITKSTSKSITVERNVITPMAAFDVQPTNEIWYTSTDGNIVTPYSEGVDVFGANIISNTYENGKGVITFDGEVTKLGSLVFKPCDNLASISIPNSVVEFGPSWTPFTGCSNLTKFSGKYASEDGKCLIVDGELKVATPAGLGNYSIPDNVTKIGHCAFYNSDLTTIIIPENVTEIGEDAFGSCAVLTDVILSNGITTIKPYTFAECTSLTNISIPDSVTKIEDGAFFHCISLTNITIPESVTSIGEGAFYYCESLTSIIIPDGVTEIGAQSFYDCLCLESVTIGKSVSHIGNAAFRNDTDNNPLTVYCKATTPPIVDDVSALPDGDYINVIYVPTESVEEYKNAEYWGDFILYIQPYNFE